MRIMKWLVVTIAVLTALMVVAAFVATSIAYALPGLFLAVAALLAVHWIYERIRHAMTGLRSRWR